MSKLSFEEIAEQINKKNSEYLRGCTVSGFGGMSAFSLLEFMWADFDNSADSEYRDDGKVTASMVERYAQKLHDMQ